MTDARAQERGLPNRRLQLVQNLFRTVELDVPCFGKCRVDEHSHQRGGGGCVPRWQPLKLHVAIPFVAEDWGVHLGGETSCDEGVGLVGRVAALGVVLPAELRANLRRV